MAVLVVGCDAHRLQSCGCLFLHRHPEGLARARHHCIEPSFGPRLVKALAGREPFFDRLAGPGVDVMRERTVT